MENNLDNISNISQNDVGGFISMTICPRPVCAYKWPNRVKKPKRCPKCGQWLEKAATADPVRSGAVLKEVPKA